MAKDITVHGLLIITLIQLSCPVMCLRNQIKTGKSTTKTGIHMFNMGSSDKEQESTRQKGKIVYPHDSSTGVYYQTDKQRKHLSNSSQRQKTNIGNGNTKVGDITYISQELNGAYNKHLFAFKLKRYFNHGPVKKATRKTTDDRHKLYSSEYEFLHRRRKRNALSEESNKRLNRTKRDISGDTQVALILGACVLGLLTAFLLICACVRCNAVRKSDDGKSTVPDYTPTLFAVAKGYDNVAFDTDDCKTESPSNEIPMIENVVNEQTSQTVSVA